MITDTKYLIFRWKAQTVKTNWKYMDFLNSGFSTVEIYEAGKEMSFY